MGPRGVGVVEQLLPPLARVGDKKRRCSRVFWVLGLEVPLEVIRIEFFHFGQNPLLIFVQELVASEHL